jgi:hypothetical protein
VLPRIEASTEAAVATVRWRVIFLTVSIPAANNNIIYVLIKIFADADKEKMY